MFGATVCGSLRIAAALSGGASSIPAFPSHVGTHGMRRENMNEVVETA